MCESPQGMVQGTNRQLDDQRNRVRGFVRRLPHVGSERHQAVLDCSHRFTSPSVACKSISASSSAVTAGSAGP
jgi:hypothetical protein